MNAGLKELTGETGDKVYINPLSVAAITKNYINPGMCVVWLHGTQYPVQVQGDTDQVATILSVSQP